MSRPVFDYVRDQRGTTELYLDAHCIRALQPLRPEEYKHMVDPGEVGPCVSDSDFCPHRIRIYYYQLPLAQKQEMTGCSFQSLPTETMYSTLKIVLESMVEDDITTTPETGCW